MTAPLYRLAQHPRRTDHLAIVQPDGSVASTMAIDATRAEIAGKLAAQGLVLHDDDTITQAEPGTTRRGLVLIACAALAGTALNVATMPAAAAEDPDARLITAAARLIELEGELSLLLLLTDVGADAPRTPELEANEAAEEAVSDEHHACGEWLAETPAHTLAGLQAKARAIQVYNAGMPQNDMIGRLTASLVSQMAEGIAA